MDVKLQMSGTENLQRHAPIALFVYNRPAHTRKTIDALARNEGAKESKLYIYSDQAKSLAAVDAVNEVRQLIHGISGFKEVIIIEQTENFGLAQSIITGVTHLCEKYGRVIVLEDDLETSPYFLKFMNEALDFYENTPEVMHVSGCRYPAESFGSDDTFFLHVPLCWGWATWQRAWNTFEKNIAVMERFDRKMIRHFNFDDTYPYWKQLEMNRDGAISTWFVFWYANIFLRGGLSLFPSRTLVSNIGFDGSGVHCGVNSEFEFVIGNTPIEISKIPLEESSVGFDMHKIYFRKVNPRLLEKILRRISKLFSRISAFISNKV